MMNWLFGESISPALHADNVLKGKSVFGPRVGQQVGSAKVTLLDDGRIPGDAVGREREHGRPNANREKRFASARPRIRDGIRDGPLDGPEEGHRHAYRSGSFGEGHLPDEA